MIQPLAEVIVQSVAPSSATVGVTQWLEASNVLSWPRAFPPKLSLFPTSQQTPNEVKTLQSPNDMLKEGIHRNLLHRGIKKKV